MTPDREGLRPVKTRDCKAVGQSCHVYLIQDRTADFEADSRILIFTAELGAKVRSQRNPGLIQAGTPFLIHVKLRNTSRDKRVVVYPIYGELSGNASDGHLQPAGMPVRRFTADGALDEIRPSPYLLLAPKQRREFDVVVRTTASDPTAGEESPAGGTHAVVKFTPPKLATVSKGNKVTPLDPAKAVEMTKGSEQFTVGVDDSAPEPPPYSPWEATYYVTKSLSR